MLSIFVKNSLTIEMYYVIFVVMRKKHKDINYLTRELKVAKFYLKNENFNQFLDINEKDKTRLGLKYEILCLDYIQLKNKNPKKFKHNGYIKCKKCERITNNFYKSNNCWCKSCTLIWRKKHYYNGYKERAIKLSKKYIKKNKDKHYKYSLKHRSKNSDKYKKYIADWHKNKYKNDPIYKLTTLARKRVKNIFRLKNWKKDREFKDYLGTTPEKFKEYIEKQFTSKMTWENMSTYWQLDHVIPIALAKTEEDVYKLSHYTNYQPLSLKKHKKKTKRDIKKIRKEKIKRKP